MGLKKILIDTNAYARFKFNDPEVCQIIQHADIVSLNPIILGELLGGFARGSKEQLNRKELGDFLSVSRVHVYPIEINTSKYYAQIYAELRKKGCPVPTNDMWIAATALEHGLTLCTYDKHFTHIDNLLICSNLAELLP
jgi:predicted nucleic acid-binding protein